MSRLGVFLLCVICSSPLVFGADGDVHTFELAWQPNSVSWALSESFDQSTPFTKEPAVSDDSIYRGTLEYYGDTDDASVVGYLWDQPAGVLYVDLNKDGDLTNDPNGVLHREKDTNTYQSFEPFRIDFATKNGRFPYVIRAAMQGYGYYQNAGFTIQSGFDGEVELYGHAWQFRFNDQFCGAVRAGSRMSVIPHAEGMTNAISSMDAPKRLFLDGRCYAMAFALENSANDEPVLQCTLTEQAVPTGSLRIKGDWIDQLVLGHDDMLVLPSHTDETVIVPAGPLTVRRCTLKHDANKPIIEPRGHLPTVEVPDNSDAMLAIGGPLQNSVDIHRSGRTLKFNYTLVGAGGETYDVQQVLGYNYEKKPTVAIYKGDLQVGAGQFEYG